MVNLANVIPFPSAFVPQNTEHAKFSEYEAIAESIGFQPVPLVRIQLLKFFEQEKIKLYDYDQVNVWLQEKVVVAGGFWNWRPLRKNDVTQRNYGTESNVYGRVVPAQNGFYYHHDRAHMCRPYEDLVPLHALQKVAKINEKLGDCVKFFVSDYTAPKPNPKPNPDPFIMVSPSESYMFHPYYSFIFDVWDEPGFGK